jgi:hypothetical protein
MKKPRNEKAAKLEALNKEKIKKLLAEFDSPGCSKERKKELLRIFKTAQSYSDSVLLALQKGK